IAAPGISETRRKSANGADRSTPETRFENVTLKVTVAALVGFESARALETTVGGRSTGYSNAPRSGASPRKPSLIPGIGTPRSILRLDGKSVKSPPSGFESRGKSSNPLHSRPLALQKPAIVLWLSFSHLK